MNRLPVLGLIAVIGLAGCATEPAVDVDALNKRIAELEAQVGPPPASLAALYALSHEGPTWRDHMFEMMMPFVSTISDVSQGDVENASANFQAFRAKYAELPQIVPEWAALLPSEPVDRLAAALESGDQAAIFEAVGGVGQVCHTCHAANMAKVQALYTWPKFADVRAKDPVSNAEVSLPEYMQSMEMPLVGMAADLQQGQIDRARANYDVFSARFRGLAAMCTECHDTEREYFIDADVIRVVDQLGTAVNANPPNPDRIMGLMQRIGDESCGKCHLVHVPTAFAQYNLSMAH